MENEKTKTAEYHPIEKLNLAKKLDKFAIFKLRIKYSTQAPNRFSCTKDSFVFDRSLVLRNRQIFWPQNV